MSFQLQQYDLVLSYISELIKLLPKLNGNYAEESISKLITRYSASSNHKFVNQMYDVIVTNLQESIVSSISGHRLWLRININRLYILLENNEMKECQALLRAINAKLVSVSELTRNSYALDVIAAEIECASKKDVDLAKLSELYRKSTTVSAAITHPRVMGVIRECAATLQFYRKNYEKARLEFYECFKHYDEAGSFSKKKVLKHLSLCSLLTDSEVSPFESHETQSYTQLPEYRNLIDLIKAYDNQDLGEFLSVIETMKTTCDPLIDDHIFQRSLVQILYNLKVRVLLKYLNAYRILRYDFIIDKLFLSGDDELEQIFIVMTNNGTNPDIKLDFVERYVETTSAGPPFPITLDVRAVKENLRILHEISYKGKWPTQAEAELTAMDLDTSTEGANSGDELESLHELDTAMPSDLSRLNVYELIFCNSIEYMDEKLDEEEWYLYMRSALPIKMAALLTQMDQVFSEQQEVSKENTDNDDHEDEVAEVNTNAGLLGSSLGFSHTDEEDEEVPINKLDLLQKWAHKLSKHFQSNVIIEKKRRRAFPEA